MTTTTNGCNSMTIKELKTSGGSSLHNWSKRTKEIVMLRIKENIQPEMETQKTKRGVNNWFEKWEMGSPQNRRQSDEWGRVYDEGNIWKEIIQEKIPEMKKKFSLELKYTHCAFQVWLSRKEINICQLYFWMINYLASWNEERGSFEIKMTKGLTSWEMKLNLRGKCAILPMY